MNNRTSYIKYNIIFIIFFLFLSIINPISMLCKNTLKLNNTLTGIIKYHKNISSNKQDAKRDLIIYLPPDYNKNKIKRYPVLYIHNGENIFDKSTAQNNEEWHADEIVQSLILQKKINDIIIVGINSKNETADYTPYTDKKKGGGKGNEYIQFIINTIKPFIDNTYRTKKDTLNTGICGYAHGGLISLYAVFKYPDIFSMAGVMSPSLYWADKKILTLIKKNKKLNIKLWIDVDKKEDKNILHLTRTLQNILKLKGYKEKEDFIYLQYKKTNHSTKTWSERFPMLLKFFFSRSE